MQIFSEAKVREIFLARVLSANGAVQNSRTASERGRVFPEFRACAAQASFPFAVYVVMSCPLSAGFYITK